MPRGLRGDGCATRGCTSTRQFSTRASLTQKLMVPPRLASIQDSSREYPAVVNFSKMLRGRSVREANSTPQTSEGLSATFAFQGNAVSAVGQFGVMIQGSHESPSRGTASQA